MTDCPNADIRDLLPGYAHGRLSVAERSAVEAHLATCADCVVELALVRAASRALAPAPAVDVARIAAAVSAATRTQRPPEAVISLDAHREARARVAARPRAWRRAAAIAAVAVGVIGVGVARHAASTGGPGEPVASAAAGPGSAAGPTTAPESLATPPESGVALSMAGGVADLSDASLQTLLGDIDALDATTDAEPGAELPAVSGIGEEITL